MTDSVAQLRRILPAVLPRLRRFARTLAGAPQEADDLVLDTIGRAFARTAQWHAPTADAAPDGLEKAVRDWLFGIMKNTWTDDRRAPGNQRTPLAQDSPLDHLPDEQRLAVALVLVEGLSYQDAAQLLDIPQGMLTARLHRGRATLMKLPGDIGTAACTT